MKTNKKLKTSFISSLTLIASTISVVACGGKPNDPGDRNYQDFVSSIKKIDLNEKANSLINKSFLKKNFTDKLPGDQTKFDFSIDSKLSEDNIMLYGWNSGNEELNVKPTKLTDLKDGKITLINNEDINIKLGDKDFQLDKIYFASNFDLKVQYNDSKTIGSSMSFKNITVLFGLNTTNGFDDLKLTDQSKLNIKTNIDDNKFNDMKLEIDQENHAKADLGYKDISRKNSMLYGKLALGHPTINWTLSDLKSDKKVLLFNMDLSKSIKLDKENENVIINCDNIVTQIDIGGTCIDEQQINQYVLSSNFFGIFNVSKPKTLTFNDGNFLIYFDIEPK